MTYVIMALFQEIWLENTCVPLIIGMENTEAQVSFCLTM